jgi:hypothetical protein
MHCVSFIASSGVHSVNNTPVFFQMYVTGSKAIDDDTEMGGKKAAEKKHSKYFSEIE